MKCLANHYRRALFHAAYSILKCKVNQLYKTMQYHQQRKLISPENYRYLKYLRILEILVRRELNPRGFRVLLILYRMSLCPL